MRKQYHFRPSKNGFYAWDVDKLIAKTRDFRPTSVPLDQIRELDENFWYGSPDDTPTCRSVARHAKFINDADLDYPIILSSDGRVMDGMHRVAKAYILGHQDIKAVKFTSDPDPDYTDVSEEDLPY